MFCYMGNYYRKNFPPSLFVQKIYINRKGKEIYESYDYEYLAKLLSNTLISSTLTVQNLLLPGCLCVVVQCPEKQIKQRKKHKTNNSNSMRHANMHCL